MSELHFDVLVRGGTVIDGSGAPGIRADVGIRGDRIVRVGDLALATAEETIEAAGKAIAPGFVDVHTHDDHALIRDPDMAMKTSQGVTTVVVGNCGSSIAPLPEGATERNVPTSAMMRSAFELGLRTFGAYFEALDRTPSGTNAIPLIGHQILRVGHVGDLERPAEPDEVEAMRARVKEAMDAGATGMSTGLFYPSSRASSTEEVVALTRAVAEAGGIYTSHIRDEGAHLIDAVDEALEIGRQAGVPVVLSHHKAAGLQNHGKTTESLARVAEAAKSQRVAMDVYPYVASSTMLLPHLIARSSKVLVTWSETNPEAAGRALSDLADEHGVTPEEMAERLQPAGAIYFTMAEEDVQRVLRYPDAMIGSDGLAGDPMPHPRLWGTFPRVLGHYARDLGMMPVEEAVRRMTGLPAERFGLRDRGHVREGFFADLVVFDPETVIDRATYENPMTPADGIELTMTNGALVWQSGAATGNRPGRALRREGRIA